METTKHTPSQRGRRNRQRGQEFELKICKRFRAKWPDAVVRRGDQRSGARESDVVIEGDALNCVRGIWWELTDSIAPNPADKHAQAIRDIGDRKLPIVVVWHKKGAKRVQATMTVHFLVWVVSGDSWDAQALVTLDLEDFLELLR